MNEAIKRKTFDTRLFSNNEYPLIKSWWTLRKMVPPELEMMPESSTFVLDIDGKPAVSLTVILTNTNTAWIDNFITDPESDSGIRKYGINLAWEEVLNFVRAQGYTKLFAMSVNDKTMNRYEEFGFKQTLNGVRTMTREV